MINDSSVQRLLSSKGLSIDRLRSFCAIVEAGSMVEAAGGNSTLQSQYSRQIKELQKLLGVTLFGKEGKFLRPTPAGQKLSLLTNGFFQALADLSTTGTGEAPTVSVGANESVLRWIVIPRLPEVVENQERVTLEFQNLRTDEIISRVKTGHLDVGIVRDDAVDSSLTALPFASLEYSLVVPRVLLPEKSAAGLLHLRKLPVAVLASEGQFVQNAAGLVSRYGLKLEVRMRVESFSLIIESLQSLDLAAFVPKPSLREFPSERFAVIELEGMEQLTRSLRIVFDPRAAAMRDNIKRLASKLVRAATR